MTIHEKLKNLRTYQMGISIRDLSTEIGIPHSNYARVEHGQLPDLILLSKLAVFYGLTLSGILSDIDPII